MRVYSGYHIVSLWAVDVIRRNCSLLSIGIPTSQLILFASGQPQLPDIHCIPLILHSPGVGRRTDWVWQCLSLRFTDYRTKERRKSDFVIGIMYATEGGGTFIWCLPRLGGVRGSQNKGTVKDVYIEVHKVLELGQKETFEDVICAWSPKADRYPVDRWLVRSIRMVVWIGSGFGAPSLLGFHDCILAVHVACLFSYRLSCGLHPGKCHRPSVWRSLFWDEFSSKILPNPGPTW